MQPRTHQNKRSDARADSSGRENELSSTVRKVMKQYFKDNNRVVIYYNQEKKAEGTK